MSINNLRIGTRLGLGFGAVLLLLIVIVAIAYAQLGTTRSSLADLNQSQQRVSNAQEWLGSSNADNSRPTSATPLSFWNLYPISNNDQWNYCYKFKTEVDTKACDVKVYFYNDKNYTHEVIVL